MTQIILVDDERINSDLIKMLLEMDGFEVDAVPTIEQAQTVLTAETAAIVLDCNLAQGVNGLELAKAVRGGETAARAEMVVIATSGDDRREAEAREVDADLFLLKPFSPSELSAELKRLIAEKTA